MNSSGMRSRASADGDEPRTSRLVIATAPLRAEGFTRLLRSSFHVVGCCMPGVVAETVWRLKPDIVLLEQLPRVDIMAAIEPLRRRMPGVKLVLLLDRPGLMDLRAALGAGANGYVTTMDSARHLDEALTAVMAGKAYTSEHVYENIRAGLTQPRTPGTVLTDRQEEVLQLVAQGKTRKEVAKILNISPKTVEFHKGRIMNLLGLRTTAELTRYIVERNPELVPHTKIGTAEP
jgi:DNA-binding NarL/FixJ family response regulator